MNRKALAALATAAALVVGGCTAETNPATNVTSTSATINAHLTWRSSEHGTIWVEYSSDGGATWQSTTHTAWGDANSACDNTGSSGAYDWAPTISPLTPNTDYVFRIAGTVCNSGVAYGDANALGDDAPYEYDFFRTKPAGCTSTISPGGDVQGGANALSPGGVLCLHGGLYNTDTDILVSAPGVTITSYPGERATIKGTVKLQPAATGAALTNLNLNGAGGLETNSPNMFGDNQVAYGNDITNDHTRICVLVGPQLGSDPADNVVIEANKIHDCGGQSPEHDHGIYAQNSRGLIVRGNWIYDNADRGIQFYPDADGSDVYGNVFDGNGEGVNFGLSSQGTSSNNVVRNNIIAHSTDSWNVEENPNGTGTGNVVRDNCLYADNPGYTANGGTSAPDVTFQNNVVSAPLFVARLSKDFRVQSGSGCLPRYAEVFKGTAP